MLLTAGTELLTVKIYVLRVCSNNAVLSYFLVDSPSPKWPKMCRVGR